MSDNTGRDELKENAIKPDVSMFGDSAGMADAMLVVKGVRIPVIKVHSFITVYSV